MDGENMAMNDPEVEQLRQELAEARSTIAHMSEAMSWISGHDRQGLDHLKEAMQFAAQLDAITSARRECEAALEQRDHVVVASTRFLRAIATALDEDEPPLASSLQIDVELFERRKQQTGT